MPGTDQFDRVELRSLLHLAAKRLKKSPSMRDLKKCSLPKAETFKKYFECDTWNEVLTACDLPPLNPRYTEHWTKERATAWVNAYVKENGKLPTRRDSVPLGPSSQAVDRLFGGWTNMLVEVKGTANRKTFTKKECLAYLKGLGRHHTYDELRLLAKEFDNPHPDTIMRATGKKIPALFEKLGMGRKYGVFGPYPVLWERICEEAARILYEKVEVQRTLTIKGKRRRPDLLIPKPKMIVEAMTSSYETAFKRAELVAYTSWTRRVECWCAKSAKELRIGGVVYVYPDQLITRISANGKSDHPVVRKINSFLKRPDWLLKQMGQATREELIHQIQEKANELGRVPMQNDFVGKASRGYQIIARTFGTFNKGLEAAGLRAQFNRKWTKEELIGYLRDLRKTLGHWPNTGDLRRAKGAPGFKRYQTVFGSWKLAIAAAQKSPL